SPFPHSCFCSHVSVPLRYLHSFPTRRSSDLKGDFEVGAPATDDPADVGSCDFVLFCVKTFDTEAAAARLGPLIGEGTAVVSLQNGGENEEILARAGGEDHGIGRAAFIFRQIATPGAVVPTRRAAHPPLH